MTQLEPNLFHAISSLISLNVIKMLQCLSRGFFSLDIRFLQTELMTGSVLTLLCRVELSVCAKEDIFSKFCKQFYHNGF